MAAITIDQIEIGTADGHIPVQARAIFNQASIGNKITFSMDLELTGFMADGVTPFELAGSEVFWNPQAFGFIGQSWFPNGDFPRSSYYVRIPSNTPASYTMVLQGGNEAFQSNDTGTVILAVNSATTLQIFQVFYMTADLYNYITGRLVNAANRLTNVNPFQPLRFDDQIASVYNETKQLGFICAIRKQGETATAEGSVPFRGNFYNTHINGALGQPVFEIRNVADTADLPSFSRFEDAVYRVTIPNSGGVTVDTVRVVAWKITDTNNGTWENTVGLIDFELLNAPAGALVYDQFFKQPSTISVGADIVATVTIDHNVINPNDQYFITVLVGYTDGGDPYYAAFNSEQLIAVSAPPEPVDLVLIDYFADYTRGTGDIPDDIGGGKVVVVPDERIEDGVLISRVSYDASIIAAGYGNGFDNDFLRFNMRVISPTNEVLYSASRQRLPLGTFGDDDVFTYDQQGDYYIIRWNHRIPGYSESATSPDWIGANTVAWEFFFDYPDFTVRYTYAQELTVRNYGQIPGYTISITRGSNGAIVRNDICGEDFLNVQAVLNTPTFPNDPQDYEIIAILDRFPFGNKFTGNGNIRENEPFASTPAFAGNAPFQQLEELPIYDVQNVFTPASSGVWACQFKVDVSMLDEGVRYMVKVIIKPKAV
jgi:hypothetical protein